ncbi:MAG: SusC/RagA family TonB-linked outer membrane protein [Chitinophagaceae bacterium]
MRKAHMLTGIGMLLCHLLIARQNDISGKISDSKDGVPLVGVTVKIKNGGATITNNDGVFTLRNTATEVTLEISFIGYLSKTVKATKGSKLTITLDYDPKSLSEVVVTGVGVATSKKKIGISVESITADKLPPVPSGSIDQALVGKIAGAQISSVDGTPGARTNILLRGINSLQSGTRPMILIDGVEVRATDLSALDLSNVERVEVVEGAASATIYGAQGANGAIQIFTKKGKAGKISIDVSSSYSTGSYLNTGNLHKPSTHGFKTDANNNVVDNNGVIIQVKPDGTYTAGVNIAGVTQGGLVWNSTSPLTDGSKPYNQNLKYYDHFKQLFRTAATVNNSITVSGGANKTDFAFTASRSYQESAIKKNGALTRYNFTSNVGTEAFKGFKIRSITQMIYQKNNFNPFYAGGSDAIYQMLNSSPFFDLEWKDANGDYANRLNASPVSINGANPNYYFQYSSGKDETVSLIQNFQGSYHINRFVDLEAKYGINYEKEDASYIYLNQSQNINAISRSAFIGGFSSNAGGLTNHSYTTTFQNALTAGTIHLDFANDLNLKVPITSTTYVAYDYRKNVFKQYSTSGDGLQLYPVYNMRQTNTQQVTVDFKRPFVTFGWLVDQAFDYGSIGGIKAGLRSDYSSAFGGGATPQTFYHGNGYLRLSQFNFWRNLAGIIPELKLRGGYGEAGIQPGAFDRYIVLSTRSIGNALAFYTASTQNNPDLKVEISRETEIGGDISVNLGKKGWLSNLGISTTFWSRKSKDVIFAVDAAPSSGGGSYLTNAFSLSSKGFQFSLNLNVASTKNFTWDFVTTFGHQSSKIDKVSTNQDIVLTASAGSTNLVLKAGDKIGQIYGLKTFRSADQTRKDGTTYINKADAGKYQVVNGTLVDTATRGIMFTNETYPIGDPNPKFNASFINSLRFKDFLTLSFQFDWVYKSHLYNQTKEWMYRDGIHGDFGDKLTVNGQTAAFSNYYISAYSDMWGSINGARNSTKDYFYEDASFVRLRNVSVAVDAAKLFHLKYLQKVQLVLSGRNLWTATKYTGFDPEINTGTSNSSYERGIDHNSMPNIKTYQVGLNIGL